MSDITVNTLKTNAIQTRAGAVPKASDLGLNVTGNVLQVQYAQYSDTFTQAITGGTDTVLGSVVLSVNITPKSTSSIIKLDAHIFHEWGSVNIIQDSVWFFYRDTTKLAHASSGSRNCGISTSRILFAAEQSSTPEVTYYTYFDSPSSTSQITYKVGVLSRSSSTLYVNRTVSDLDTSEYERGISFISATEIGG